MGRISGCRKLYTPPFRSAKPGKNWGFNFRRNVYCPFLSYYPPLGGQDRGGQVYQVCWGRLSRDCCLHMVLETGGLCKLLVADITLEQGDQLDMAVCFWYLVKRDMSSVRNCTVETLASLFTRYQNVTCPVYATVQ